MRAPFFPVPDLIYRLQLATVRFRSTLGSSLRRLLQVGARELDAGKVADWNPGILGDEYLIALPALSHHDLERASGRFDRAAGVEAGTIARAARITGKRSGADPGGCVIAGYFDHRVRVRANDVRRGVGRGG